MDDLRPLRPMKLTLPENTKVITLDGHSVSVKYCNFAQVAVYSPNDPYKIFAELRVTKSRNEIPKATELTRLSLFSGQHIHLPRRSLVMLDKVSPTAQYVESLGVAPKATTKDWKNSLEHLEQRKWNNQWQIINVPGKPIQGSDVLKSWTNGVSEIVRNVSTVEGKWDMIEVEIELPSIALAIVADRPGMFNQTTGIFESQEPDGILVMEDF